MMLKLKLQYCGHLMRRAKSFEKDPDASGDPVCRGTFGGRRKAVKDRIALQGGTGDFP